MEQTMLIAVLIAALVGLFLFDTVRLRRMQVQRDAAKEEVAEVKTEFLSRISHEIKTPMNVIVGATALGLEETEHPERMEECLNRIRGASEFLMGLLNDLVDMSKIENGKFHLHPKPYSFTEFLNEVENMMEPMCERKWIRFHMPHEEININMMVDPVRFFQIFFNLLSNAVKFTPEGGEVTFRICNYATHNNQFCADYVVSDNGMGMSEEFQQILFQPFTQESVNQGERGNGAGLGLAIVRSIVDLMGGTITVKSEPQKGTEIKVHLEIEIAEIQPEIEVAHRSAEEIQNILRGKRVLLVDFDPQANLSEYLKYEPNGNPTMTQLIMSFHAGTPLNAEATQNAIRHNDTAGVDYIPSDINLANAETLMVTMISKEHILRRILTEDVVGAYDFVLIDCLPSLGTLLINVLTAADRVLIPVQTQKFSMDGLQSLEALTQLVKANTNPKLDLIGVLPTMVDRTKVSRTAIDTLNEKYGEMLFRTSISKSIEAAKSSENGIPLCLTGHKLGQEYDELAQ